MCLLVVWPVCGLIYDLRLRHAERIPATGGVLLVANHVSVLDPLACAMLVYDAGRVPRFLAKSAVFTGLAGTILRAAGQIPVYRGTSAAQSSMSAAEQALAAGEVVIIYPEGSVTRDPDWWPMQPRTGAARLALTTDAVVVPLAQWGPQRVHDYHAKKLHLRLRTRADYLVGEPVEIADLRDQVAAVLTARGADPVPTQAAYQLPFPVLSAVDAARLAVTLEEGTTSAWVWVLDQAAERSVRETAVAAACAAEVRAVSWRPQAGVTPVTTATPGLPAA
ncbi:hypothetical protein GCM10023162_27070 [Klenkia terrae]